MGLAESSIDRGQELSSHNSHRPLHSRGFTSCSPTEGHLCNLPKSMCGSCVFGFAGNRSPTECHTYMHACRHTYIHADMQTCRHTYMHTYIPVYLVCTYVHMYTNVYMHEHTSRHKRTRTRTHMRMYVRMYVCMYV